MTDPNDYIPDLTEQDGPYEMPDEDERPEPDEDLYRDR